MGSWTAFDTHQPVKDKQPSKRCTPGRPLPQMVQPGTVHRSCARRWIGLWAWSPSQSLHERRFFTAHMKTKRLRGAVPISRGPDLGTAPRREHPRAGSKVSPAGDEQRARPSEVARLPAAAAPARRPIIPR